MTSAVLAILQGLHLERAPNDTVRAQVLMALMAYAKETGLSDLEAVARQALPKANPFVPPKAWLDAYRAGFEDIADPECGVCPDESARYGIEYWQGFTDAEREERLAFPELGGADGQKDADALNDA